MQQPPEGASCLLSPRGQHLMQRCWKDEEFFEVPEPDGIAAGFNTTHRISRRWIGGSWASAQKSRLLFCKDHLYGINALKNHQPILLAWLLVSQTLVKLTESFIPAFSVLLAELSVVPGNRREINYQWHSPLRVGGLLCEVWPQVREM